MKRGRIICLLSILLSVTSLVAQEDTESLRRQGNLHFRNSEWHQALQIYEKLLIKVKNDSQLYTDAVIASFHLENNPNLLYYTELARTNRVSIDTLFDQVKEKSRQIGKSHIYEYFLIFVGKEYTALKPDVNRRLMIFYKFRNNNARLVAVVREMLIEDPENLWLKKTLAEALYASGSDEEAVELYKNILTGHPDDTDALLFLGIYYYVNGLNRLSDLESEYHRIELPTRMQFINYKQSQTDILERFLNAAAGYLERACTIRSTPVIENTLNRIACKRKAVAAARYSKSRN